MTIDWRIRILWSIAMRLLMGVEDNDWVEAFTKLDVGRLQNLCPVGLSTCGDGQRSFLCKTHQPEPRCQNFSRITMTYGLKKFFVQSHNGIRHKIANDWNIANMNTVYWSDELSMMALYFMYQCVIEKDTCLIIGEKELPVNQNFVFRKHLSDGWPGRVVRGWYLQLGLDMQSYTAFLDGNGPQKLQNFSQLIWPTLEFIGCNTAHMFNGYFVVCYYYPPYAPDQLESQIILGEPCTQCSNTRFVCSTNFNGLCGKDVDPNAASTWTSIHTLLLLSASLLFIVLL